MVVEEKFDVNNFLPSQFMAGTAAAASHPKTGEFSSRTDAHSHADLPDKFASPTLVTPMCLCTDGPKEVTAENIICSSSSSRIMVAFD